MLNKRSAALGLATIASLTGLVLPATAAPIKDATGAIFVDGLPANSRVAVQYSGAQKTINANADACGRILIRNSSSTPLAGVTAITLNGATIDTSALPMDTLSRCVNGTQEVNHSNNFRLPDGSFVLVGRPALSQNSVGFPGITLSRQVSVNACGFIKLTGTPQYPLSGTLNIGALAIDTATVAAGNPPLCRNGVLYVPQ